MSKKTETKLTAVQWIQTLYNNIDEPLTLDDFNYALQLEREQIEEAYIDGLKADSMCNTASEYYNQTFKPNE